MRKFLLALSFAAILFFTYFSYTVAKERWIRVDFDTMVKIQDHIPRRFDQLFSYLTVLGDIEVTLGICVLLAFIAFIRKHFWAGLGWLAILPASLTEIFGKLVLFHPSPPVFFHRTILPSNLPQFYVHTNFSYPSGHMTRTFFLLTVFFLVVLFSKWKAPVKFLSLFLIIFIGFMMTLTRVYLGEHWMSDVLGGGLLGLSAGLFSGVLIIKKKYVKI